MVDHPYRDAAQAYYAAGWHGALPIRGKWPPPKGWTGTEAAMPSWADVLAWCDGSEGELNIGLRLPEDVIGIDVDHYGDKRGGRTIAEHEAEWGPLPATWISTSRDDGVSGIRLYRVPPGLAWPGQVGPSVEVIRHGHRYAMVAPSLHPEGRRYVWRLPDAEHVEPMDALGEPPRIDDLPALPAAWVQGLTGGRERVDLERADLADPQTSLWLAEHGQGEPCAAFTRTVARAEAEIGSGAGRHDAALRAVARIAYMTAEGHSGGLAALERVRQAFAAMTQEDPARAEGEWRRMVAGAVRLAAVAQVQPLEPCSLFTGPPAAVLREPRLNAGPSNVRASPITSTEATARVLGDPGPAEESGEQEAPERTSWWPVDLGPVLSGEQVDEAPSILERDDGRCLFYRGRVNGLIGPSESGKSWIALLAVAQELGRGENVVYIDFEDTARGIVGRLLGLGVDPGALLAQFAYIGPDEAPGPDQLADLGAVLDEGAPSLVVLDGVNAAMSLAGLDLISNTDATRFYQALLKPITREDRAILSIDHTPKSRENDSAGGIGAQAKRALTSGCAIRVDKKADFGPGVTGYLKLSVDKDRTGGVREFAANAKIAAEAIVTSEDGTVEIALQAYDAGAARERTEAKKNAGVIDDLIAFLSVQPDREATQNVVVKAIRMKGKERALREAAEAHPRVEVTRKGDHKTAPVLYRLLEAVETPFGPVIQGASKASNGLPILEALEVEKGGLPNTSNGPLRSRGRKLEASRKPDASDPGEPARKPDWKPGADR